MFRSLRATREIRAGCVWVNDHIPIISEMPHGGYKASGFGKDMSPYSFEEYTQVKHVMYDSTAAARKDWHRTIFTGSTGRPAPTQHRPSRTSARGDLHVTDHRSTTRCLRQLVAGPARPGARCSQGAGGAGARRRASPPAAPASTADDRRAAEPTVQDKSATDKIVNWSNWPDYIDVDDKTKKYPTLERSRSRPASRSTYTEDIDDNDTSSPRSRPSCKNGQDIGARHHRPHRLDGRPADPPG